MLFTPIAANTVLAASLLLMTAASAAEVRYEQLDPSRYQSFVANWTPEDRPLCAVIQSQADWDGVLKPAPVMGGARPFSPPAAFWETRAVLLVARVVSAGDMSKVFQVAHLETEGDVLRLEYGFKPPPPGSYTVKWYLALAVAKPLPPAVRFEEDGSTVCALRTDAPAPGQPGPR